jgi:CheY-specific phosphatase CheX
MASAMLSKQRRVDDISEPTITAGEPMSIKQFPEEILLKIFSYCKPEDLCHTIPKVCER